MNVCLRFLKCDVRLVLAFGSQVETPKESFGTRWTDLQFSLLGKLLWQREPVKILRKLTGIHLYNLSQDFHVTDLIFHCLFFCLINVFHSRTSQLVSGDLFLTFGSWLSFLVFIPSPSSRCSPLIPLCISFWEFQCLDSEHWNPKASFKHVKT